MLYTHNPRVFEELIRLYCIAFEEDTPSAKEILGYARDHGEIHYITIDDRVASILCLTELEGGLTYLFAAATHPDYRGHGLMAENLAQSISDTRPLVCIPQSESLFSLYAKLGFSGTGGVLCTTVRGTDEVSDLDDNIDLTALYEIYTASSLYPKKPEELFYSTLRTHLMFGGQVIHGEGYYALWQPNNETQGRPAKAMVNELCIVKDKEEDLLSILRSLAVGETSITLPVFAKPILDGASIPYDYNKIFALRSRDLDPKDLYINILYN